MNFLNSIKEHKYTLATLFSAGLLFLVSLNLFFYTIESNPVLYHGHVNQRIFSFVPQGWAFFTRNPREPQDLIYRKDKTGSYRLIAQHLHHYKNLFGLVRRPSKILTELQAIKAKIPDANYSKQQCNFQKNTLLSIDEELSLHAYKNIFESPNICGEYIFAFQKIVPWAWASNLEKIQMPCKMIHVEVSCNAP